jgi:precorrin-6B methylase 2
MGLSKRILAPVGVSTKAGEAQSAALKEKTFDCVLIGAGIRTIPPLFLLFEKLVNVVHEGAPQAKICFNTVPADTAVSVQRWV